MGLVNKNDIALGIGTLEFGTFSGDTFQNDYRDVGAIKAEVNFEIVREVMDFETGRPLLVVLQEVIRERITVTATLAEVSAANIKASLGQGNITTSTRPTFADGGILAPQGTLNATLVPIVSGTLMTFGGLPTHAFVGLRFTHQKSTGKRQIFEAYRASPVGNLTLPFRETDWNIYQVQFRLLADTTKAAGAMYYQFFMEQ